MLPDDEAARHGQLRVIDESGEDYLYPERCFVDADLSDDIRAVLVQTT